MNRDRWPLSTRHSHRLCGAALAAALVGGLAAPAPARADDVYLTNGRAFEGVIAKVQGDEVAIRLHQGVIRIPRSRVERIVRETVPLELYLERKTALTAARDTTAADWLELALWARRQDFAGGYREAARQAAALDPDLEALRPVMLDLGYQRDGDSGGWYTFEELMQRRGMVSWRGRWMSLAERDEIARAEYQQRLRQAEERRRDDAQAVALVELAAAARAQAEAERAREQRSTYGIPYAGAYVSTPVVYTLPGWFFPAPDDGAGGGGGGDGGAAHGGDGGGQTPRPRPSPAANHGGFRPSDWIPGRLNPNAAPIPGSLGASPHGRR